MSRRVFFGLLLLNAGLLATNLLMSPPTATGQVVESKFDCCASSNEGAKFCCDQCCRSSENCDASSDCRGDVAD